MLLSENTDMSEAVRLAQSADGEESIGVLGEKTLHSALKYYYCMECLCRQRRRDRCFAHACRKTAHVGGKGYGRIDKRRKNNAPEKHISCAEGDLQHTRLH